MKHWIWLPFVLVLGLVLGGWPGRADLRRARARATELEESLRRTQRREDQLQAMVRLLRIPTAPRAAPAAPAPAATNGPAPAASAPGDDVAAADAPATNGPPPHRHGRPRGASADMRAQIEEASGLWRTRSQIARETLLANAGLSREEATRFDVLVEAMNVRLGEAIRQWTDRIKADASVAFPETGARMLHDLSGVFVLTYNEMDRALPAGWRDQAGPQFDLISFVDPSVALPLVEVQDRLQAAGPTPPGRP